MSSASISYIKGIVETRHIHKPFENKPETGHFQVDPPKFDHSQARGMKGGVFDGMKILLLSHYPRLC